MSRYSITTQMSFTLLGIVDADWHEVELKIGFDVNPSRAQSSLEPGEPASVSVANAQIGYNGKWEPAPDWLWPYIESDEGLEAEMLAEAWEANEASRDDHADMIREERLLERRA